MVHVWDSFQVWELTLFATNAAEPGAMTGVGAMVKADTFGTRLQALLKQRRMTLAQAASKAKISKSTLHNWTVGHAPTDFQALDRLCQVLESDINFLLLGKAPAASGSKPITVNEVFSKEAILFDGFAHIKVTKLVPRLNVIAEGEDDDE